jgi:hypothetical protein
MAIKASEWKHDANVLLKAVNDVAGTIGNINSREDALKALRVKQRELEGSGSELNSNDSHIILDAMLDVYDGSRLLSHHKDSVIVWDAVRAGLEVVSTIINRNVRIED